MEKRRAPSADAPRLTAAQRTSRLQELDSLIAENATATAAIEAELRALAPVVVAAKKAHEKALRALPRTKIGTGQTTPETIAARLALSRAVKRQTSVKSLLPLLTGQRRYLARIRGLVDKGLAVDMPPANLVATVTRRRTDQGAVVEMQAAVKAPGKSAVWAYPNALAGAGETVGEV
jgi:hypothetical protein